MPGSLKSANHLMVGAMLVIGVANILWAEQLTVNGGFGWDGLWYSAWARDFYHNIFVVRVPEYYVQRILPSAIVHYGMRVLGVSRTDQNIILAFQVYNLLLLLLSVHIWGSIANRLRISNRGKWLGFCFLFLNYAILKNNFYHAVLTDTSAFTLGLLMFYFFLADNRVGLLAVILAGGFTWPTVPYMAALLYVFPRQKEPAGVTEGGHRPSKLNFLLAASVSGLTLVALLYVATRHLDLWLAFFGRVLRIDFQFLYVSMAAVLIYLFLGLKTADDDRRLFDFRAVLKSIRWKRATAAVFLIALIKLTVHQLASGQDMEWGSFKGFVVYCFLSSLTEPFIFLVAHVVYYGPVILLLLFFWKPFCQSISEFDIGMRFFIMLNVVLSINPQSRYQINVVTAFIVVLVLLLDRAGLSYRSLPFWALLCLFYSKVWYRFNTAPQIDDGTMDALQRFPLQHYFMNSGPWMSHQMYLIHGGLILLTGILLYFLFVRNHPAWTGERGATKMAVSD